MNLKPPSPVKLVAATALAVPGRGGAERLLGSTRLTKIENDTGSAF
jgi:hypothetical protein